jgi:hypothetical protein
MNRTARIRVAFVALAACLAAVLIAVVSNYNVDVHKNTAMAYLPPCSCTQAVTGTDGGAVAVADPATEFMQEAGVTINNDASAPLYEIAQGTAVSSVVGLPGVDGGGGATLPAAGAYETAPTTSSTAGVAIPTLVGSAQVRGCHLTVVYTQGDAGGQMSSKVYGYDGAKWGQLASSVDQSYNAIPLGVNTGQYALDVDVRYGITRLMLVSAETGETAYPGSYLSEISCN